MILSNLPKISEDKVSKLKNVLEKIIEKKGVDELESIEIGMDQEMSNGFAILRLKSEEGVKKCIQEMNNLILDKNHTLKAYNL